MLTIFTIPKPFHGHINIIQRNAILSWLQLRPPCEVILFGDDEGVAETAKEFGVLHIPKIEKNAFGTPFLSSAFNLAQRSARNEILVYVNADIILMSDLISAVQMITKPLFLMSGRRWDLNIKEGINFDENYWEERLKNQVLMNGKLHRPSGMDYCVFPRNLQHNFPLFAVGRPGWDNWLIYRIRSMKIPMIDATGMINIVHQNHDYSHSIYGKKQRVVGPERQESVKLAGGFSNMLTLRDADWVVTPQGLKKPKFPRSLLIKFSLFYPWRLFLLIKRMIQR